MSNILKTLAAGTSAGGGESQISRSLRFNSADSAYLSRTPASAGNRKTWTWSGWVKIGKLNEFRGFMCIGADNNNQTRFRFNNDNTIRIDSVDAGSYSMALVTTQVFRDLSAWYHIVFAVDTTQSTDTNRVKIYVNGERISPGLFSTETYPSPNYNTHMNTTNISYVGYGDVTPVFLFDGYMTEVNCIDGQALTPSSFGETNATTGVWSPIAYAGSYGTNGFYLNFSDNSNVTAATLGKDDSGNGNNWTPSGSPGFSVTAGAGNDSLVDVPTRNTEDVDTGAGGEVRGNYCVINPLAVDPAWLPTITNGNLDISVSGALATISMPTGTWYWEATCTSADADQAVGALSTSETGKASISGGANPTHGFIYQANGNARKNGTVVATWATFTNGDVISFTYDASTYELEGYKNSVSQGTITLSTPPSGDSYVPMACCLSGSFTFNFGQRPFAYTAPSGFKALVTTNLPDPTVVQGDDYFNTVLYTGDGSNSNSISTVGFQPDWVWVKGRTGGNNSLYDAVRGAGKVLFSNTTEQEYTTNDLTSFDSSGFTVSTVGGTRTETNANGQPYVAWNWKAGVSNVTNGDGTITSTVRANTTSGFSIVTFTDAAAACTVGHGLGVAPAMIIAKFRGSSGNWSIYHQSLGNTYRLRFTTEAQLGPSADWWNNTSPTSTVFSLGSGLVSSTTQVAYCFAPVEGFSKFGSYRGNGSTNGPFVYTGFRPAFFLVKRSSASGEGWWIYDDRRNTFNIADNILEASSSNAEISGGTYPVDFLSNGLKIRGLNALLNTSGATYIYMALASNPFKYALAR